MPKEKPSFFKRFGIVFAKLITDISLSLAILFMILAILFMLVGDGSLLSAYLIYQKHPFVTIVGIILAGWIGLTLPASITSILIPEPVISKISGSLGITTDIAAALLLLIMIFFFSAIGTIISLIIALIFLFIVLLFKKLSNKKEGALIFISGILCFILFFWFLITLFFFKDIIFLMFLSLILSLIFLLIGGSLLFPYSKKILSFLKGNKLKKKK